MVEIVVVVLNLFVGVIGVLLVVITRSDGVITRSEYPISLIGIVTALGAFGTSLLVTFYQKRLAARTQWLTFLGMLLFLGYIGWAVVTRLPDSPLWSDFVALGASLVLMLLFAWFAQLLKRLDN